MGLWIVGWKASEGKEGEGEERGGREGGDGGGMVYRMQNSRGCWKQEKVCIVLRQKNSLVVYGKTNNNNITT